MGLVLSVTVEGSLPGGRFVRVAGRKRIGRRDVARGPAQQGPDGALVWVRAGEKDVGRLLPGR